MVNDKGQWSEGPGDNDSRQNIVDWKIPSSVYSIQYPVRTGFRVQSKGSAVAFFLILLISAVMCVPFAEGVISPPPAQLDDVFLKNWTQGPLQINPSGNSGGAGTSIPIAVPQGRKGLHPNLTLGYSSGSGNGWVGVGWTLDMGSIQRNAKRDVDYSPSSTDFVVSVNGAISELVRRVSWDTGSYEGYQAKTESAFSKYLYSAVDGWMVITKDGTKYYYGNDYSRYQSRQTNSHGIFKWCLEKVEDTNGNYMEIFYSDDQGQVYLDRIEYTGNSKTGINPYYYVNFHLDGSRTDTPPMYSTNSLVRTAQLLKTIEVGIIGGAVIRAYDFDYQYSTDTKRSLLVSATQYGTDAQIDPVTGYILSGTELPSLTLEYYDNNSGVQAQPPSDIQGGGDAYFSLDLDGNGKDDLVKIVDSGGLKAQSYLSNGSTFSVGPSTNLSGGGFQWMPLDVNGDGKDDIVEIADEYGGLKAITHIFEGSTFSAGPVVMLRGNSHQWMTMDVNGDGMSDIVEIVNDGAMKAYAHISHETYYSGEPASGMSGAGYLWLPLDVNGDGKSDIVELIDSAVISANVYLSDGSVFTLESSSEIDHPRMGIGHFLAYLPMDVNGDGKTDLVNVNDYGGISADIYLSNGSSFSYLLSYPLQGSGFKWMSMDANGDGRSDLVEVQALPAGIQARIHASDGSSFQYSNTIALSGNGYAWLILDVDGNGKSEVLEILYDTMNAIPHNSTGPPTDYLHTISNGIGATTTLTYRPSSAYTNNTDPDHVLPFIVQTLASIEINDGNTSVNNGQGNTSRTEYWYERGNFDYSDRGFWGFESIRSTVLYIPPSGQSGTCIYNSAYECTVTESIFNNTEYALKGLALQVQTSDSTGNLYTKSINTYEYDEQIPGVVFPYLIRTDNEVYDGTATPRTAGTTFAYDEFGNLTEKHFEGYTNVIGDERHEYTHYEPHDMSNWLVSLPKTVYVIDSYGRTVAQKWFDYYPITGNLSAEEAWLDDGPNPVIYYFYLNNGNLWRTVDPRGSITTVERYDSTYTYPELTVNHLGHSVTKQYDARFGTVEWEEGPNGNRTSYTYDEFGRTETVTGPKDQITPNYPTMKYEYLDFGTLGDAVPENDQRVITYALEEHGADEYLAGTGYFDGFGRTVRTESEGPVNKTIVSKTEYNDRGLAERKTMPFFKGLEAERWTVTAYDPIGRAISTEFPDGTASSISYLKGTTYFIDPEGHMRAEVKDIYGRIIEVQEFTGSDYSPWSQNFTLFATTINEYDALGNLEYIRDAEGNETMLTFDSLSRKLSIYDPDSGLWEYAYDENGNLTYQIDTEDNELWFDYDELNRIKKKRYSDATSIDYLYDAYENGSVDNTIGRLTKLTDKSGTTTYYYDDVGNTIQTDKDIIGSGLFTTYSTYDAMGRTKTLTYPDGITVVEYVYGTGGYLLEVRDPSDPLNPYVRYISYNALGQVEDVLYRNTVTTHYTYRPDNNRLETLLTNSPSAGNLMDLQYGYDDVGNITSISDSITYPDNVDRSKNYEYDDSYRLIKANSDSYEGNLLYQYDRIGNMTYNCRYGHYDYDNANHAHAASKIRKADGTLIADYSYDLNGNMTAMQDFDRQYSRSISYDFDNRAESIIYTDNTSGTSNALVSLYDASGKRVKKVFTQNSSPVSETVYIGDIYECKDNQCTKYIFAGSNRIAKIDSSNSEFYYHTDHLGSATIMTGDQADSREQLFYYPYGEFIDTGESLTNYKFTDQEWDAETGLYYYGARYYDPKLARFISADTIVPDYAVPQSLNRYSYVMNNPIMYIDPSGQNPVVIVIVVSAIIGAVSAGAQSNWNGNAMIRGAIIGAASAGAGSIAGAYVGAVVGAATGSGAGGAAAGIAGIIAGGATGGFISAVANGGNIGTGALLGAAGALASTALGGVAGSLPIHEYVQGMLQIVASGAVGGLLSELSGGNFLEGFGYAAGSAAVALLIKNKFFVGNNKGGEDGWIKGRQDSRTQESNVATRKTKWKLYAGAKEYIRDGGVALGNQLNEAAVRATFGVACAKAYCGAPGIDKYDHGYGTCGNILEGMGSPGGLLTEDDFIETCADECAKLANSPEFQRDCKK